MTPKDWFEHHQRLKAAPDALEGRSVMIPEALWSWATDAQGGLFWTAGSRMIEGAAGPDSQMDFLMVTIDPADHILAANGFTVLNDKLIRGKFKSWRNANCNIIATTDFPFAMNFMLAQLICEENRVVDREARVTIFKAMMFGDYPKRKRS